MPRFALPRARPATRRAFRSIVPVTSSSVPSPTNRMSSIRTKLLLHQHANRLRVAQRIVEGADLQLVEHHVDDEPLGVRELADDAQRAAADRRRKRREALLERARVGIERRIGEAQRDVGILRLGQIDAAGARHGEARRSRLDLDRHAVAAHVERGPSLRRRPRRRRTGRGFAPRN